MQQVRRCRNSDAHQNGRKVHFSSRRFNAMTRRHGVDAALPRHAAADAVSLASISSAKRGDYTRQMLREFRADGGECWQVGLLATAVDD